MQVVQPVKVVRRVESALDMYVEHCIGRLAELSEEPKEKVICARMRLELCSNLFPNQY
jgi:hypothetical protein